MQDNVRVMFDQPNAPYDPKFCNQAGTYRVDVGPRFYIGSTTRLGSRHSSHRADLAAGKHPNKALQAAWDEHQDFRFTVLTLIPEKYDDVGRDHAERLKFYEQRLLDDSFADPNCCNASESSRYNTTLSGAMKAKWLDPEYRISALRKMRESRERNPVSAETRRKMSEAKRGIRGPAARPCVILWGSGAEETFESVTAAALRLGRSVATVSRWFSGASSWPRPSSSSNPVFTGRYIDRSELAERRGIGQVPEIVVPRKVRGKNPTREQKALRWAGEKFVECELTFSSRDPERFTSVHAAARIAKVTHLRMYQWLTGERPWPDGLTGRAITPL